MADDLIVTEKKLDQMVAEEVLDAASLTRTALGQVLPKPGAATVPAVAQYTYQRPDGAWLNPVRDGNVGGRVYVGMVDANRPPTYADGLAVRDLWVSGQGLRVATFVPSAGAPSWATISAGGSTTIPSDPGSGTPTDPGTTPTPGDTSTPSATARPNELLSTTGVWTTTGGTTLVQALSDQAVSGATAVPSTAGGGVSVTVGTTNFLHAAGNDLVVTVWGASSTAAGPVTASVGFGSKQYVATLTKQVTGTAAAVEFRWSADAQLALPAETWRDVQVTIARATGGLTVADVTVQSLPPIQTPSPGTDTGVATAILWAPGSVWYSDCTTAPAAKASTATAAYVRAQATTGTFRLDCYGDAAPIWMVPGSTPRVNVTPPAAPTRGAVTVLHTADGKGVFDAVPMPAAAAAPANTFKTAVVACVETKQIWEFLGLTKTGTVWAAEWGGRIDNYPSTGGAFPTGQGYTGSGLAWAAPAVKLAEAKDALAGNVRAIPHAVGLNLNYDSASPSFCWPATRSDGTSADPAAPKMGQRLRLKASADLSGCTPVGRAVGEAMKRYGAVVMGGADKVSVIAESGATEQATTGVDPWGAILAGKSVDTVLAGIPLDQLEAVSPGWGDPAWKAETDVTTPTTPTTPTNPGTNRRAIYINPGVTWLSGASCRGIENSSEGMGSAYAQWRGEPCWFARCWADQGGSGTWSGGNDPGIASLFERYSNWHASMDVGIGFFHKNRGENMAGAAAGNYDARWTLTLQNYRKWWTSRRNPAQVNAFISPAHEMNGNWYSWSVNSGNYTQFITAWKRFRNLQLQHFPESLLCFNANRDTSGAGMDWRKMVAGYAEGASEIKKWVDVGGVDYYNMDPNSKTASDWAAHIMENDGYGAPKGLERHRQFWLAAGLPLIIPEWSNNKTQGDSPAYAVGMNDYMRKYAGTGPGQICADALFNLTGTNGGTYYSGEYAVMGDTVGSPNFAAKYRELKWGV